MKILCVDFDGVLHSYASGWRGPRKITDPPVPGAIKWLQDCIGWPEWPESLGHFAEKPFQVCIYSSRSRYFGGRRAMKRWLLKHGLQREYLAEIRFPLMKPPAFLQIDDRAMTFTGTFPTIETMKAFVPWNKMPKRDPAG